MQERALSGTASVKVLAKLCVGVSAVWAVYSVLPKAILQTMPITKAAAM